MGARDESGAFLFAGFRLDRRGLFRDDAAGNLTPVAVGGRAFDLLWLLVERHGELASKAEIMAAVWPDVAVEDGNLTLQISTLRRVLDQGCAEGSCIQTVARRGYRFVASVTRLAGGGLPPDPAATGRPPHLSIVVLPFANLSADPTQEYFADGITDDLTTDLSRIAGSFVIARSTALAYKGKPADMRAIGRELGVRYALEGSVRRSGGRLRINVQLIDAETGGHVWAERIETLRTELAEAENDLIGRLAHSLNLELVEHADRRTRRERAAAPDAEDLVMQGWAAFYRPRSEAGLQQARRAFEQALALAPHSVEPRIGLATALAATIVEGWSRSLAEDQARVERLLEEIFAHEAHSSMAHYATAMLRRSQQRPGEARIAAEHAVAFDRNNAAALYELGLAEMYCGRPEAAIAAIEKAIRLSPRDPLLAAMSYGLGRCRLFLGDIEAAIALFEQVRAARPRFWDVQMWLAAALALTGDIAAARARLAAARRLKPEIGSIADWRTDQPWIATPAYNAMRERTLYAGLRRAGFPD